MSSDHSSSDSDKKSSSWSRFFGFGRQSDADADSSTIDPQVFELAPDPGDSGASFDAIPDSGNDLNSAAESGENSIEGGNTVGKDGSPDAERLEEAESLADTETGQEAGDGIWSRWSRGLGKTRSSLGQAFRGLLGGRYEIDDDLEEEIETLLLTADVGIDTTGRLIEEFREKLKKERSDADLMTQLRELMVAKLSAVEAPVVLEGSIPTVLMMVGVNGVGKTTSIGKLARQVQRKGKSVMLAAGDTFRAAAVEQLQVWGDRNQVPVVAQRTGSDSASVIYDALQSAQARKIDVLIVDTAGRLHNKGNLMEELSKVVRVMQKLDPSAPHELLLVLDAATGQNAVNQAREFCKSVPVTGLILTKLDGTAKGGVVFALVDQLGLPVKLVGLGEGIDDLAPFQPRTFVDALFGDSSSGVPLFGDSADSP